MHDYLICDDMTLCTQADVERLNTIVSPQRREQAMRYKHVFGQWACLKSYEMLLRLLHIATPVSFVYNEHGKPFLPQKDIFFSISHCKEAVAVVVSDREVGIDIESRNRRVSQELIERVMNEDEQRYITTHPEPATAFIELWTKKEALLKQLGTGIIDDLTNVLTGNENIETHIFDNYIVSICQ